MNKKLKRMAVVGATVLMTASSVGFSNAMQVKKSCDLNLTGKMYVCINGKRFKLDLSCYHLYLDCYFLDYCLPYFHLDYYYLGYFHYFGYYLGYFHYFGYYLLYYHYHLYRHLY